MTTDCSVRLLRRHTCPHRLCYIWCVLGYIYVSLKLFYAGESSPLLNYVGPQKWCCVHLWSKQTLSRLPLPYFLKRFKLFLCACSSILTHCITKRAFTRYDFKLVLYIFFYEHPTSDGIFALTWKSEIKMLFEILLILTLSWWILIEQWNKNNKIGLYKTMVS